MSDLVSKFENKKIEKNVKNIPSTTLISDSIKRTLLVLNALRHQLGIDANHLESNLLDSLRNSDLELDVAFDIAKSIKETLKFMSAMNSNNIFVLKNLELAKELNRATFKAIAFDY